MPMTAVTNVPADTPLADELADEDLVEMANLPEEDTGISGTIFVFRSKRADRLKILAWDGSGLILYWKRLEEGAFRWPPISDGVARLSASQLAALVDGLVAPARAGHAGSRGGVMKIVPRGLISLPKREQI